MFSLSFCEWQNFIHAAKMKTKYLHSQSDNALDTTYSQASHSIPNEIKITTKSRVKPDSPIRKLLWFQDTRRPMDGRSRAGYWCCLSMIEDGGNSRLSSGVAREWFVVTVSASLAEMVLVFIEEVFIWLKKWMMINLDREFWNGL